MFASRRGMGRAESVNEPVDDSDPDLRGLPLRRCDVNASPSPDASRCADTATGADDDVGDVASDVSESCVVGDRLV